VVLDQDVVLARLQAPLAVTATTGAALVARRQGDPGHVDAAMGDQTQHAQTGALPVGEHGCKRRLIAS